jgi:hypothetical protein
MEYLKKTILLLMCLISFANLQAQRTDNYFQKSLLLKVDATKLIEPDMNISFAVEKRFSEKFSWQVQADYIFNSYEYLVGNAQNSRVTGFRIVPEIRNYIAAKNDNGAPANYIALQVLCKYQVNNFSKWFNNIDGAGQQYLELKELFKKKTIIAPHLMYGKLIDLDGGNRWSLDLNTGIGVRFRNGTQSPEALNNGLNMPLNFVFLSVAGNLKLCYTIKR